MPRLNEYSNSEETREILGRMPSWIVRRGIGVIALTFVLIVIGCYFIKYPQLLTAPVVITTINPPADLVSRYDGRIDRLLVVDGDTVHTGDIVALLESPTDYDAVTTIENALTCSLNQNFEDELEEQWLEGEYQLGELQSAFSSFQALALEYRSYLAINYIGKKMNLLEQQIAKNTEYCGLLEEQLMLAQNEMVYVKNGYVRDSLLYVGKAIATSDMEKASRALLQQQSVLVNATASITSVELQIMQNRQQIIELDIQRENDMAEYGRNISRSRQELLAAIAKWKEQFVLASPIDGHITFISYWSSNQRIKTGERLASIIPIDSVRVIGRLAIPSSGFGKVKCGQTVNVKLNGYPYMEFGMLKGEIASIAAVPDEENTYQTELLFPKGLKSTYNKQLPLIQQMDGTGEIITEDMRLIEQFVRPIRALFIR